MQIKVSVSLDEGLVARIDHVADTIGANRSSLIQKMVERSLLEYETFAASFGDEALSEVKHDVPMNMAWASSYKDFKTGKTFKGPKGGSKKHEQGK